MKYGEAFLKESVPQWAPYNVDYNELKNLIKVHTTKDQGQAIAIPGQADTALAKFEDVFFNELYNQHDRVDLFVKSKADEIGRRLQFLEKQVIRLLGRLTYNNGKPMSQKRREKFAKYDAQIAKCAEDTKSLQRFVDAQRMAFQKILKKYKKWTGSRALGDRFNTEVLSSPKSFIRRDLSPLLSQANNLSANLRASTPDTSGPVTPSTRSRRPSVQVSAQQEQTRQAYWNEYDDGSEAENEPYTIYVDPDSESMFPGSKAFTHLMSSVKLPMEKIKDWLTPTHSPDEQRPLLGNGNGNGNGNSGGYFTETDIDDDAYASSSDFPTGYATHYATFPSVRDQKYIRSQEALLFYGTIVCFVAAVALFLVACLLIATGKHKLRVEVDVGTVIGIVSSFFFATLGLGTMLYRKERLGWLHKSTVGVAWIGLCVLNLMLLVLVVGNSGT